MDITSPKCTDAQGFTQRAFSRAASPDLPIDQLNRFELLFNTKTANMLGIDIPLSIQMRADEVIE